MWWIACVALVWTNILHGFCAGTLVKTPEGYTSIEQLRKGMLVVCCDAHGVQHERPITATQQIIIPSSLIVSCKGEHIYCAPFQLFYLPHSGRWCNAMHLVECSELGVDGVEVLPDVFYGYELTVEEHHTFYVSSQDILVHNAIPLLALLTVEAVYEGIFLGFCIENFAANLAVLGVGIAYTLDGCLQHSVEATCGKKRYPLWHSDEGGPDEPPPHPDLESLRRLNAEHYNIREGEARRRIYYPTTFYPHLAPSAFDHQTWHFDPALHRGQKFAFALKHYNQALHKAEEYAGMWGWPPKPLEAGGWPVNPAYFDQELAKCWVSAHAIVIPGCVHKNYSQYPPPGNMVPVFLPSGMEDHRRCYGMLTGAQHVVAEQQMARAQQTIQELPAVALQQQLPTLDQATLQAVARVIPPPIPEVSSCGPVIDTPSPGSEILIGALQGVGDSAYGMYHTVAHPLQTASSLVQVAGSVTNAAIDFTYADPATKQEMLRSAATWCGEWVEDFKQRSAREKTRLIVNVGVDLLVVPKVASVGCAKVAQAATYIAETECGARALAAAREVMPLGRTAEGGVWVSTHAGSIGEVAPAAQVSKVVGVAEEIEVGAHCAFVEGTLAAHEAEGGHALVKHVYITEEEMIKRAFKENTPVSYFYNREIAERVCAEVFEKNKVLIQEWLKNSSKGHTLRINHNVGYDIGKGFNLQDKKVKTLSQVKICLRHKGKERFFVITAFPI